MIARFAAALAILTLCSGCATIAEKAVDVAIKNCWTFDGFSGARQCPKQ